MMPRLGVLLGIKSAAPAKNIGIIRSIVEVLRKVSLRREAEHIEKETGIRDVKILSPNDPLTEWTKSQSHTHHRRVKMMNARSR